MIRKMVIEDYEEVKELFFEVHNLHFENRPDIYNDGNPLPKEIYEDFLHNSDNLNFVYVLNNKIAGVMIAKIIYISSNSIIKARKICFIDSLAVRECNRRQGIGLSLYKNLKEEIRNKNIDAIELNVWNFNQNAIRFYESLGMNIKNIKYEDTNI